jgi:hypothetical protein
MRKNPAASSFAFRTATTCASDHHHRRRDRRGAEPIGTGIDSDRRPHASCGASAHGPCCHRCWNRPSTSPTRIQTKIPKRTRRTLRKETLSPFCSWVPQQRRRCRSDGCGAARDWRTTAVEATPCCPELSNGRCDGPTRCCRRHRHLRLQRRSSAGAEPGAAPAAAWPVARADPPRLRTGSCSPDRRDDPPQIPAVLLFLLLYLHHHHHERRARTGDRRVHRTICHSAGQSPVVRARLHRRGDRRCGDDDALGENLARDGDSCLPCAAGHSRKYRDDPCRDRNHARRRPRSGDRPSGRVVDLRPSAQQQRSCCSSLLVVLVAHLPDLPRQRRGRTRPASGRGDCATPSPIIRRSGRQDCSCGCMVLGGATATRAPIGERRTDTVKDDITGLSHFETGRRAMTILTLHTGLTSSVRWFNQYLHYFVSQSIDLLVARESPPRRQGHRTHSQCAQIPHLEIGGQTHRRHSMWDDTAGQTGPNPAASLSHLTPPCPGR